MIRRITMLLAVVLSLGWLCACGEMTVQTMYSQDLVLYIGCHGLDTGVSLSAEDVSASSSMVDACVMISESETVLKEVAAVCEDRLSYEQLREMIDVSRVADTETVCVTVSSDNADNVQDVVKAIETVLPDTIRDRIADATVKIVSFGEMTILEN